MSLAVLALVLVIATLVACAIAYNWFDWSIGGLAVILLVGVIAFTSIWSVSYRNEHWATCHVTGKDRGANNGSYRVYTSDCDTLSVKDSFFRFEFNASNRWQQIPGPGTYRFLIAGSRIPFFSQFPNILEVKN